MSPQRAAQVAAATVRDLLYSNPIRLALIVGVAITLGFNIGRALTFYQFERMLDRMLEEHNGQEGLVKERDFWRKTAAAYIRHQQEASHQQHEAEANGYQATSEATAYSEETAEPS